MPVGLSTTSDETMVRSPISSKELSNVLGGGLVPGSFILLSGEPGIGKSTLALQIADWYARNGTSSLYISAEENVGQIASRAKRLGITNAEINLLSESVFEHIVQTIENDQSGLVILDSISVFQSLSIDSNSGTVSLIRAMAEALMQLAKRTKKAIIIIGHVTKDGSISGPKTLEHLVDTVLFLEGSRYENYRILRALKNRFGPTDEIGLFRMGEDGLSDIENPGLEFIDAERTKLIGSAVGMTIEGTRPLVIEIEALTTYTKFGYPKRSARGIPQGKIDLLLAVLSKYTDLKLESYDVYANIGRGLTVSEPGIDLALAAAIISSKKNLPLGNRLFLGEISLTGLVKHIYSLERRIDEAIKLGFDEIYYPATSKIKKKEGIKLVPVESIAALGKLL